MSGESSLPIRCALRAGDGCRPRRNLRRDFGDSGPEGMEADVRSGELSAQELIHPNIDVHAQYALRRLSKQPAAAADAAAMLAAVQSGRLGGIYKEDQRVPALLARRQGQGWWQLIPAGKDAARVGEPGQAPLIVFRDTVRSNPPRLDPALLSAWREGAGSPDTVLIPHERLGFLFSRPAHAAVAAELDSELDEEILGDDERRLVAGTLAVPFRFICSLRLHFGPHPTDSTRTLDAFGTGLLISPRHLLTAGHCLFDRVGPRGARELRTVDSVEVFPARNAVAPRADQRVSFGPFVARGGALRVSTAWRASQALDPEADFGLITLPAGANTGRIGFWGTEGTLIQVIPPQRLRNARAQLAGYPLDKCVDRPAIGSASPAEIRACPDADRSVTQWVAGGRIVNPSPVIAPNLFQHSIDMVLGMSGGPVWIETAGRRLLVGLNTLFFRPLSANVGLRITEPMLAELRAALRDDGVQPTF